jgi:acyl carrier protein
MNTQEARQVIFEVLGDIAPEVDPSIVDDDLDLTEQLDLDSMDYLTWRSRTASSNTAPEVTVG